MGLDISNDVGEVKGENGVLRGERCQGRRAAAFIVTLELLAHTAGETHRTENSQIRTPRVIRYQESGHPPDRPVGMLQATPTRAVIIRTRDDFSPCP